MPTIPLYTPDPHLGDPHRQIITYYIYENIRYTSQSYLIFIRFPQEPYLTGYSRALGRPLGGLSTLLADRQQPSSPLPFEHYLATHHITSQAYSQPTVYLHQTMLKYTISYTKREESESKQLDLVLVCAFVLPALP